MIKLPRPEIKESESSELINNVLVNFDKQEMQNLLNGLERFVEHHSDADPRIKVKYDKITRQFSHDWARFFSEILELFSPKA